MQFADELGQGDGEQQKNCLISGQRPPANRADKAFAPAHTPANAMPSERPSEHPGKIRQKAPWLAKMGCQAEAKESPNREQCCGAPVANTSRGYFSTVRGARSRAYCTPYSVRVYWRRHGKTNSYFGSPKQLKRQQAQAIPSRWP